MEKSKFKKISQKIFLNEGNYKDFKNDETKTSKKKLNESIARMNGMLSVIERILKQNIKLKNETMGENDNVLWKTSEGKLHKIRGRMTSIFELFSKLKSSN